MKIGKALNMGLKALTTTTITKVIVAGIGGIILSAMSDSIVDDVLNKNKKA